MNPLTKIQASAMQFAVLISALVVLLLAGFLLLSHTQEQFRDQTKMVLKTISDTDQAIFLGMRSPLNVRDSLMLESDLSTTSVRKSYWGAFEKLTAQSNSRGKEFSKQALVASKLSNNPLAVQIGSWDAPLVLAGEASVKGNAKVSDKGVKPGIINGDYFNGTQLIQGNIFMSSGVLPKLDPDWLEYVQRMQTYIPGYSDQVVEPQLKVDHSFDENILVIYTPERMFISEEYNGHILIKSETEIIIGAKARLSDVLIVAPKISFEKGFQGRVHCVASEKISISQQVHLKYPSSLVLHPDTKSFTNSEENEIPVLIPESSMMEGAVIYLKDPKDEESMNRRTKIQVKVDTDAYCRAMFYCEGNLELKGMVHGTVFTKQFVANEGGSMYMNHLYNGGVDATQLPEKFGGLPLLNAEKSIVKWLY